MLLMFSFVHIVHIVPVCTARLTTEVTEDHFSLRIRYFSRCKMAFLMLSLFLILYEHSTFKDLVYSPKGRLWYLISFF